VHAGAFVNNRKGKRSDIIPPDLFPDWIFLVFFLPEYMSPYAGFYFSNFASKYTKLYCYWHNGVLKIVAVVYM